MERIAVFVDAGYFWVQVSHIVFGEKRSRDEIDLDADQMRKSLLDEVRKHFPGSTLLRIYWYDGLGTNESPSMQQKMIARLDDIKMRYGTRNSVGQQKGVDGLLMADLIALAQNKAISSALIISGDADLAPGISAAQMLGVRIHRLEIGGKEASSPILVEEVDRNSIWDQTDIEKFSRQKSEQACTECERENLDQQYIENISLEEIACECIKQMSPAERESIKDCISIPQIVDRKILYTARSMLNRMLTQEERVNLRKMILDTVKKEVA